MTTRNSTFPLAAAFVVMIGFTVGLWAFFGSSPLSNQVETCLKQSNYACLTELAYKYPPMIKSEQRQLEAAVNLAYLGKLETAFSFYEELEPHARSIEIVSAILVYLTVEDRGGPIF